MAIVFPILFWLLVAILAVFVLALVTPLRIELSVMKGDAWQLSAALRPFGRFGPKIPLSRRTKEPETAHKPKRDKRKKWGKLTRKPQRIGRAALRLVTDLIHCVRLHAATVDLTFGLGDPGETGQVFGLMAPLIYGPSLGERVNLNVVPAFDRTVLTGRLAVDFSIIPASLLAPTARFGWTAFGPRQ
ncbi:MAG: DUF2953 domain-containing protein [Yoonia sp.]|nr:DUF2953 domain-containing protein [Yoonia sp.]